jgi:hypothetical protein
MSNKNGDTDIGEKRREMCKKIRQADMKEFSESGKVIDFPKDDTLEQYAEDVKRMLIEKRGKAAVIIKADDGFVYADYWGCGVGDMFEIAGHVQLDAVNKSMKATYILEPKPE